MFDFHTKLDVARALLPAVSRLLATPCPATALLLVATLGTTSCWFRKTQPKIFNPPPIVAKPAPQPGPPATLPLPGETVSPAVTIPETVVALPDLPPPPKPVPPKKPVVAAAPKPVAPALSEPEPAPVLRIGQIFTPEQTREFTRTLDESLERVRKALAVIAGKTLTPPQSQIAESIRSFQRQAEQAREQDLLTAVNLARRADLLAKDLLERLP